MKLVRLAFYFMLVWLMQACSQQNNPSSEHTITIEPRVATNSLYYSGTIQPLRTLVVTSPADGVVVDMPFQYGEAIKNSQLLFMISSAKFLTDYKTALMQYVKAKSDFNNGQTQLSEAEFLHKNQLISDDDFKMKQANFYGNQLALLQAKDALENLQQQLNIKDVDLNKLSIADIDKIKQAMHLQMSAQSLRITAPAQGIILAPAKNDDENKKVLKGDTVKQGDVLATIGDLSGLSVNIKVNELVINQLKLGQKVKVTGIAFPDETLNGFIKRVDRQGEATNGGLPTFTVEVIVPKLTAAQQQMIHVGMSAKVQIDISEDSQIMVPIAAVNEKAGQSFVRVLDQANQIKSVAVKTGKTTQDSVTILTGLNSGDKIVIPN